MGVLVEDLLLLARLDRQRTARAAPGGPAGDRRRHHPRRARPDAGPPGAAGRPRRRTTTFEPADRARRRAPAAPGRREPGRPTRCSTPRPTARVTVRVGRLAGRRRPGRSSARGRCPRRTRHGSRSWRCSDDGPGVPAGARAAGLRAAVPGRPEPGPGQRGRLRAGPVHRRGDRARRTAAGSSWTTGPGGGGRPSGCCCPPSAADLAGRRRGVDSELAPSLRRSSSEPCRHSDRHASAPAGRPAPALRGGQRRPRRGCCWPAAVAGRTLSVSGDDGGGRPARRRPDRRRVQGHGDRHRHRRRLGGERHDRQRQLRHRRHGHRVRVRVGDRVKKGQVLATVDPAAAQRDARRGRRPTWPPRRTPWTAPRTPVRTPRRRRDQVTQAELAVDEAEAAVDGTVLTAPMAGTVVAVNGTVGSSLRRVGLRQCASTGQQGGSGPSRRHRVRVHLLAAASSSSPT